MGLNFKKIIASTNINDTIPRYLSSGIFDPKKTKRTISNAMDVSIPNNFPRIEKIYNDNFKSLSNDLISEMVNEFQTKEEIKKTFHGSKYILDPHGAVGLVGLKRNLSDNETGVFFETAHPIKFMDSVGKILKIREDFFKINLNFNNKETIHKIKNDYNDLVDFIKLIN